MPGLIWGRTVFCIDIGNSTLIHMVKLHLPHMYMIVVDNFIENDILNLLYNTHELSNTFGIIHELLKPIRKDPSAFFVALTAERSKSSAPSRECYNQRPQYFCFTGNNGCRAKPKVFGASRRNVLAMDLKINKICEYFFWKLQTVLVELYNHY